MVAMGTDHVQVINFHPKHYTAIASGQKVSTTRWNDTVRTGPALFHFEGEPNKDLRGQVLAVHSYPIATLSPEQAHQPPETNMDCFAAQLRENYYADMPDTAIVDVVTISVDLQPQA